MKSARRQSSSSAQQQKQSLQGPTAVLNPTAVRERAKSVPGCKEVLAEGPTVLSFIVVGLGGPNHRGAGTVGVSGNNKKETPKNPARVNIWTDTGTVGTSRVINGQVRQSFRRHVQSLDVIERVLKNPEGPIEINESLVGMTDESPSLSSPRSVQKEIELADVGLCILQGEKDKLQKHLDSVIEAATTNSVTAKNKGTKSNSLNQTTQASGRSSIHSSPRSAYTTSDGDTDDNGDDDEGDYDDDDDDDPYGLPASSSSSLHGTEFHFKLPTDVMNQVDQCLNDISQMGKTVKGVATNGKGTVFLYGNGGVAYTPAIPKALYQKLRQLRSSSYSSRPSFVALGTRDRYYVCFNDGTADWKGPGALDKILKKAISQAKLPRCVAFGSTYDTFFVVFHDGSWQYQGRGIPETLETKLGARNDRADLDIVNLGPSGEWFIKAENGRMWWSGISNLLDERVQLVLNGGGYLHSMDFGENGRFPEEKRSSTQPMHSDPEYSSCLHSQQQSPSTTTPYVGKSAFYTKCQTSEIYDDHTVFPRPFHLLFPKPTMALRNVDVFIKPRADIRSKSAAGGIITLVAGSAACLLFFAQLYLYIVGTHSHSLHLSSSTPFPMLANDKYDPFQSRAYDIKGKMPLKIHLTFMHISCHAIEIKLNGTPVTGKDMSSRGGGLKRSKPNAAEIKKMYGSATSAQAQAHAGRGCTLSGTLRVPIVAGSITITLTRDAWATALNHFMVRSQQSEEERARDTHLNDYNMSHHIHQIQFGKTIPPSVMAHSSATSSSHQYEEPMKDHVHIIENQMGGIALEAIQVKLVPTVHTGLLSENTYMQMSVVEHTVQPETMVGKGIAVQPGLSLTYDITPLAVHQNEGRDNILIFLSSLCGIVGGVFVTVSLLTGCLVHSAAAVAKKVD